LGRILASDLFLQAPQRLSAVIYGTAQQPLTQLYKVHLAVAEAQLGVRSASEQLRQAHQDLTRQVRESYYSISQAQSQLHATETALAYLKELSVEAQNNLTQQTVLQADAMTETAKPKDASKKLADLLTCRS
jgi:outer membrane protein TolC